MMFKIINKFLPKNPKWRTTAVFLIAVIIGLGAFMAKEAELTSYLSDDPKTCVNCHVMIPVYNSWMHSSHRQWASCNDCHVPHNNIFNKYLFKMKDGLIHSAIFTLRAEPEVMFMRKDAEVVVQNNCLRCHVQQVTQTKYNGWISSHKENRTDRHCWDCHKEVPHGKVHGISTLRNNIAPIPTDIETNIVPDWLKNEITKTNH